VVFWPSFDALTPDDLTDCGRVQQAGAAADIKKLTDNGLFTIGNVLAHSTRKELKPSKA
jgi:hypothetical protein